MGLWPKINTDHAHTMVPPIFFRGSIARTGQFSGASVICRHAMSLRQPLWQVLADWWFTGGAQGAVRTTEGIDVGRSV